MYEQLIEINKRTEPFQFYTAEELWVSFIQLKNSGQMNIPQKKC